MFLCWCVVFAYNRSIRVKQPTELPFFAKQGCLVNQIENQKEDKAFQDLNLYYSGLKKDEKGVDETSQSEQIKRDKEIQQEILKIVEEKQKASETSTKTEVEAQHEAEVDQKKQQKIPQKIKQKTEKDGKKLDNKNKKVEKKQQNIFSVIDDD